MVTIQGLKSSLRTKLLNLVAKSSARTNQAFEYHKGTWPIFITMLHTQDWLAREVVGRIELENPEADVILRRNFIDFRNLYRSNPDGSSPCHRGAGILDRLSAIKATYRLEEENIGPHAGRVWSALQAAAFVVKQDLVKMAEYAAELEEENRRLRQK